LVNSRVEERECLQYTAQSQSTTTMDDELIQVKAKIAATKKDLATAKTDKDRDLVLSLTNLLTALYEKELLLLSAG
jgi:hypothetical protein